MARAKATDEHKKQANKAAAIVSACVLAFAALFVGLIVLLDNVGPDMRPQEIEIADKAPVKTFYVLLIGSDTRKGTALYTGKQSDHGQVDQHSDVMTLMRVNPDHLKITLLTIPRDTVIAGEDEKINNALLNNDPEEVVDAVERLTGLRPDYYMMTTFATFANLIDALGGVDVDVPVDIKVDDPATGSTISVKAGDDQHLNGSQALALARARHEYGEDQDVIRQANVRAIEEAMIERVLQYHDIEDIERLLGVVEEDVVTNMDLSVTGLEIVDFMRNADKVDILGGTGPYEGGVVRKDGQWVIPQDEDAWKKVMKAFKGGYDPKSVISLPARLQDEVPDADRSGSSSASGSSASASSASASSASASASASSAGASASSSAASASAASASSDSSSSASSSSSSSSTSTSTSTSSTSDSK